MRLYIISSPAKYVATFNWFVVSCAWMVARFLQIQSRNYVFHLLANMQTLVNSSSKLAISLLINLTAFDCDIALIFESFAFTKF